MEAVMTTITKPRTTRPAEPIDLTWVRRAGR
jgi:hypothetical protein